MFISKETTETHLAKVDFFRTARIFLRIFGIWPMDDGLSILFYINFISLFITASFGVAHGFANLNNLFLALQSFCGSVFEFISWTKLAALYYFRKEFGDLLRKLHEYYTKKYNKEHVAFYREGISYSMFATVMLASGGLTTCTIYVFSPILKNLYFYIIGEPLVREQPFQAVYPYIDQYADNTFLPVYIHLTHGGYCTAIGFNGVDSIFITTCFHIAAQFKITATKIRDTFGKRKQTPFSAAENQEIRRHLIEVMEDQIKLFELIDLFISVFISIILMHFISVALIIGIGSIDLLLAHGTDKILYAVYIATVATQSFAYAYSGNQITEHSLDICSAVWDTDWHYLDLDNQKIVYLMILRSQKAKYIRVPFFEVTLNAYTKIMSTAGSYITLLNNMLK